MLVFLRTLRLLRAVVGAALLSAVLIGVPVGLVRFVGWPLPRALPSWSQLRDGLAARGIPDEVLVKALACLLWPLWLILAVSVLAVATAAIDGRPLPSWPPLRLAHLIAGSLIGLLTVSSLPGKGGAPALATSVAAAPHMPGGGSQLATSTAVAAVRPQATGRLTDDVTPTRRLSPIVPRHKVRRGETLWGIAEALYPRARPGDIPRIVWKIYAANRGVSDHRGHHLHDPDLINPGMRLRLPVLEAHEHPHADTGGHRPGAPTSSGDPTTPAPAPAPQTSPETPPAPATPPTTPPRTSPDTPPPLERTPPQTPPSTAPNRETPPVAAPLPSMPPSSAPVPASTPPPPPTAPHALPAAPQSSGSHRFAPAWLGIGTLLATGFLALWGYRRRRRDMSIRPGQAAPRPDPEHLPLQAALQRANDSAGIHRLDAALRTLTRDLDSLPVVETVLVRASGDIDVLLREPQPRLPDPWRSGPDPRIWTLPHDADLPDGGDETPTVRHPCPALVQLGTTEDGAALYLDLEAVGVLAVDLTPPGGTATMRGVSRALVATLVTSPLATLPQIRTVGFDPYGLTREERLVTEPHLQALLEHAAEDAARIRDALAEAGLTTTTELRIEQPEEVWDPTIAVIATTELSPEQARQACDLARPGSGLAAVLPAVPGVTARWHLHLDQAEAGTEHGDPGSDSSSPTWRLDPLGITVTPMSLAASELRDLTDLLAEAEAPPVPRQPTEEALSGEDTSGEEPAGDTGPSGRDVSVGEDAAGFVEPDWQVMVCLLGPPQVVSRDGRRPANRVRERTLEALAWMVTHRRHATSTELATALWPQSVTPDTIVNVLADARRVLRDLAGPDAHGWIPRRVKSEVHIDDRVISDLGLVEARLTYATRHRDQPADVIPVLREALRLVRGAPVAWGWLDAELGSTLTTTPVHVATLLAEAYLAVGDLDGVLEATAAGLAILPAHPAPFALRMRARAAAGDHAGVRAEYESYLRAERATDDLADVATDHNLQQLYQTLIRARAG